MTSNLPHCISLLLVWILLLDPREVIGQWTVKMMWDEYSVSHRQNAMSISLSMLRHQSSYTTIHAGTAQAKSTFWWEETVKKSVCSNPI